MPLDQQQYGRPQQGPLNFIVWQSDIECSPGDSLQSTTPRAVRSHAARVGWKSRKRSQSVATRLLGRPVADPHPPVPSTSSLISSTSSTSSTSTSSTSTSSTSTSSTSTSSTSTSSTSTSSTSTSSTSTSPTSSSEFAFVNHQPINDNKNDNPHASRPTTTNQTLAASHSNTTSTLQTRLIGSTHDPFSQFPVRWEDSFGTLIHFYRTCIGDVWMQLIAADWGHQMNREFVDYPLQISISQREPAIFYAVLSNTSTMAPSSNTISMRKQPFLAHWLRHKAVQALSKAIADPKRAYTDAIICTVVYVYSNEALRNQRDTALKVHAPALLKMVAARGGLAAIALNGKPGLLLSRYLTWTDRIVAATLGTPLLFPDYVEDLVVVGQTQQRWSGIWDKAQKMM